MKNATNVVVIYTKCGTLAPYDPPIEYINTAQYALALMWKEMKANEEYRLSAIIASKAGFSGLPQSMERYGNVPHR